MSMGNVSKNRFPTVDCSKDVSRTVQASRDEVDINRIVARIEKGLSVPVFNGQPFYGDVSSLGGLQEAIIKVQEAKDLFMEFPATIRERFGNDPVNFVEFMADPANTDEAVSLGLALAKPINYPPVTTPPVTIPPAVSKPV